MNESLYDIVQNSEQLWKKVNVREPEALKELIHEIVELYAQNRAFEYTAIGGFRNEAVKTICQALNCLQNDDGPIFQNEYTVTYKAFLKREDRGA